MLIRYKKAFEKIAMGLLSFMPNVKDFKTLQQTIKMYDTEKEWQLYLWKADDTIIGLIGVTVEGNIVTVRHICVSPSHRDEGIGKNMIMALKQMHVEKDFCPSEETAAFFDKCRLVPEASSED